MTGELVHGRENKATVRMCGWELADTSPVSPRRGMRRAQSDHLIALYNCWRPTGWTAAQNARWCHQTCNCREPDWHQRNLVCGAWWFKSCLHSCSARLVNFSGWSHVAVFVLCNTTSNSLVPEKHSSNRKEFSNIEIQSKCAFDWLQPHLMRQNTFKHLPPLHSVKSAYTDTHSHVSFFVCVLLKGFGWVLMCGGWRSRGLWRVISTL